MANIETKYTVELKYIHKDKETVIETENIKYITIQNEYISNNFPIIFMQVNLKSSLYDKMLKYIEDDTVTLTIGKFDTNKKVMAVKNYIKQEFIYYFANTDSNYQEDLEKEATDKNQSTSNAYRIAYIGLLSVDINNYNRKLYNDIISGSMQSVVYKYLSDIKKIIIEPFDNNKSLSNIIIPPIVGLSNLINYLFNISAFYKSHFLFFIDLTKTCFLLSCNGNGVKRKSNEYSSVIVDVDKTARDNKSKTLGMYKDTKAKCFKLNINQNNYMFSKDIHGDKEYNKIVMVDSMGKVTNTSSWANKNDKVSKVKLIRSISGNSTKKSNIEYLDSITDYVISVTKQNVDSSVLTPEKSYNVLNTNANKKYDGKYILISKQEVFRKEDEKYFTSIVTLKLSKTVS